MLCVTSWSNDVRELALGVGGGRGGGSTHEGARP